MGPINETAAIVTPGGVHIQRYESSIMECQTHSTLEWVALDPVTNMVFSYSHNNFHASHQSGISALFLAGTTTSTSSFLTRVTATYSKFLSCCNSSSLSAYRLG